MGLLTLGHIIPIRRENAIVSAKIRVYEDDEEYFSFITPEAYYQLEKWICYRKNSGETMTDQSWGYEKYLGYKARIYERVGDCP